MKKIVAIFMVCTLVAFATGCRMFDKSNDNNDPVAVNAPAAAAAFNGVVLNINPTIEFGNGTFGYTNNSNDSSDFKAVSGKVSGNYSYTPAGDFKSGDITLTFDSDSSTLTMSLSNFTGFSGNITSMNVTLSGSSQTYAATVSGAALAPHTPTQEHTDHENNIEDENDDIESAANLSVLTQFAGTYTVSGTAEEPTSRGTATRDHARGNIIIGSDGAVDFDTEISFSASDINAIYDRTMLTGDIRRVHVNYDADDSGRKLEIYLDSESNVTEIRYSNGAGELTRAAIEAN